MDSRRAVHKAARHGDVLRPLDVLVADFLQQRVPYLPVQPVPFGVAEVHRLEQRVLVPLRPVVRPSAPYLPHPAVYGVEAFRHVGLCQPALPNLLQVEQEAHLVAHEAECRVLEDDEQVALVGCQRVRAAGGCHRDAHFHSPASFPTYTSRYNTSIFEISLPWSGNRVLLHSPIASSSDFATYISPSIL